MSMVQGLDYEDLQDYACQLEDEIKRLRAALEDIAGSDWVGHEVKGNPLATAGETMQDIAKKALSSDPLDNN